MSNQEAIIGRVSGKDGGISVKASYTHAKHPRRENKNQLTHRERQIATQIAVGKNDQQISKRLMIPASIVKRHRDSIRQKLKLTDMTGLVLYEINNGYTPSSRNDPMNYPNDILDHLPVIISVIDMQTHEVLYASRHMKKVFGDIAEKMCWQVFQKDQSGPCQFCSNHQLMDEEGLPTGSCRRQVKNELTQCWYDIIDVATMTKDGRMVKMGIAIDITDQMTQQPSRRPRCAPEDDAPDRLEAMVVVCSHCNKLRDESGQWESPAGYFHKHLGTHVSHGICEKCAAKLYPWIFDGKEDD
ncbi:response regulator transcription factor [Desulfosarcina ovata]|nr:helix-turn-helix transcriptional regulator [Desulfosarcina ovata]